MTVVYFGIDNIRVEFQHITAMKFDKHTMTLLCNDHIVTTVFLSNIKDNDIFVSEE